MVAGYCHCRSDCVTMYDLCNLVEKIAVRHSHSGLQALHGSKDFLYTRICSHCHSGLKGVGKVNAKVKAFLCVLNCVK